jgi:hypothetical protein
VSIGGSNRPRKVPALGAKVIVETRLIEQPDTKSGKARTHRKNGVAAKCHSTKDLAVARSLRYAGHHAFSRGPWTSAGITPLFAPDARDAGCT